ncbi:MAG: hypothetical protein [Caudoviricetes sp.]|nr:MAG: hypothetical protein [Caudoviricetes sp.]
MSRKSVTGKILLAVGFLPVVIAFFVFLVLSIIFVGTEGTRDLFRQLYEV